MRNKTARPQTSGTSSPIKHQADWSRYELLKSEYTAKATTRDEYDEAVRRAILEAGV